MAPDDLDRVAEASRVYSFKKNELVFAAGDASDALFVVESGRVSVVSSDDSSETTIAELVRGDSFGELELLTNAKRAVCVVAKQATSLLRFPKKRLSLKRFQEEQPETASRMLLGFMVTLAGRIRKSNELVKENSPWVQELRRQAYGDKLTGLYNKTYLEEQLPKYCVKPETPVGLLMFKPDNFKDINDRFGHEAGDNTLKLAANALKVFYDDDEPVIRYMGNELAILLPEHGRQDSLAEAKRVLALMNGLDLSSVIQGEELYLSVSIGVALYPEHASTARELIDKAHALPLIGRARGGNRILFPEDA